MVAAEFHPIQGHSGTGAVSTVQRSGYAHDHSSFCWSRLTFAKTTEEKVKLLLPILYPLNWLKEPAEAYGHPEITNGEFLTQVHTYRINLARRQTLVGSLSQMAAAKRHYVSPDRLKTIAASIPKVYIMTGDEDNLVRPENSHHLKSCMPEAEFEVWEHSGW